MPPRQDASAAGARAPRLVFAALVALLAAGLVRWSSAGPPLGRPATAMVAGYLAWVLAEIPVTFRRGGAVAAESRTLLPYAGARLGVVLGAVVGPLPWSRWSPWLLVPMAVFGGGVLLRLAAIRTLGRFYSHQVARQPGHRVVTTGPYRLVRHPAYLGMLLTGAGFAGFFANPVTVVAALLLVAPVALRIRAEESVVLEIPGYRQYASGRARLLPGVW